MLIFYTAVQLVRYGMFKVKVKKSDKYFKHFDKYFKFVWVGVCRDGVGVCVCLFVFVLLLFCFYLFVCLLFVCFFVLFCFVFMFSPATQIRNIYFQKKKLLGRKFKKDFIKLVKKSLLLRFKLL